MKKILMFLVVAIALFGFANQANAAFPFGSSGSEKSATAVAGDAIAVSGAKILKGVLVSTSGSTGDTYSLYSGASTDGTLIIAPISLTVSVPVFIPCNLDISANAGDIYQDVTDADVDVTYFYL
jgi:hypothetical protein